jgi:hypothetical protein
MYPVNIAVANQQWEKKAGHSMSWALWAERIHIDQFGKAAPSLPAGEDIDHRNFYSTRYPAFPWKAMRRMDIRTVGSNTRPSEDD